MQKMSTKTLAVYKLVDVILLMKQKQSLYVWVDSICAVETVGAR